MMHCTILSMAAAGGIALSLALSGNAAATVLQPPAGTPGIAATPPVPTLRGSDGGLTVPAMAVTGRVSPVAATVAGVPSALDPTVRRGPAIAPSPRIPVQQVALGDPATPADRPSGFPFVPQPVEPTAPGRPLEVDVHPGVPAIFKVAQGHFNRIVTPFKTVAVRTTSAEKVEVRGNILYIAPKGDTPVTMFLVEDQDESRSLNVAFVPAAIAPVELHLRFADPASAQAEAAKGAADTALAPVPGSPLPGSPLPESMPGPGAPGAAPAGSAATEASFAALPAAGPATPLQPPEANPVAELLRTLAAGQVPVGYTLRTASPQTGPRYYCARTPGFTVSFAGGQHVVGDDYEAHIGIVRNASGESREFTESWCAARGVVAVGLWPSPVLQAGETVEIFVIRRRGGETEGSEPGRPSLLTSSGATG